MIDNEVCSLITAVHNVLASGEIQMEEPVSCSQISCLHQHKHKRGRLNTLAATIQKQL